MDDPKNGHFGGVIAAPVFKAMAERIGSYLNIRPDIQPDAALDALAGANSNITTKAIARRTP